MGSFSTGRTLFSGYHVPIVIVFKSLSSTGRTLFPMLVLRHLSIILLFITEASEKEGRFQVMYLSLPDGVTSPFPVILTLAKGVAKLPNHF